MGMRHLLEGAHGRPLLRQYSSLKTLAKPMPGTAAKGDSARYAQSWFGNNP